MTVEGFTEYMEQFVCTRTRVFSSTHECIACGSQKRASGSLELELEVAWDTSNGCWEPNLDPRQEQ